MWLIACHTPFLVDPGVLLMVYEERVDFAGISNSRLEVVATYTERQFLFSASAPIRGTDSLLN